MARKSRIAENAMSIISAKEGAYKTAVVLPIREI